MRSAFAVFLRGFVLPFGATTGQRLFFDGDNGRIQVFNSAGDLIGEVTPDTFGTFISYNPNVNDRRLRIGSAGMRFFTGDSAETVEGVIAIDTGGIPAERRLTLAAQSPNVGNGAALLNLVSASDDGVVVPQPVFELKRAGLNPKNVSIRHGSADGVGGTELGRGVLRDGFQRLTTNDSARAAGVATDMSRTVELHAGRLYRVHFHSRVATAATAGGYGVVLDRDGTQIGVMEILQAPGTQLADGEIIFEASADDASTTFTIENDPGSVGTITLQASADNPRTLLIEDIGVDTP